MAAVKRQIWQSKKAISNTNEVSGGMVLVSEFKDDPETPEAGIPDAPNDASAYVRSGLAWVVGYTKAAIDSLLGDKEDTITATTSADYYRGDKTFQPLNKNAVGLGNVDNTSDVNKPISSATQGALDATVKILVNDTVAVSTSGTGIQLLKSYSIPPDTFTKFIFIPIFSILKSGTANNANMFVNISNTNNFSTSTQIARFPLVSTQLSSNGERTFLIDDSDVLKGYLFNGGVINDKISVNTLKDTVSIDKTQTIYIWISGQCIAGGDTVGVDGIRITN